MFLALLVRKEHPICRRRLGAAGIHLSAKDKGLQDEAAKQQIHHTLNQLEESKLRGDFNVYSSLLRQCSFAKALEEGKRVHSQLIKDGYSQETVLNNMLVKMYGDCGSLEDARNAFDNIRVRNVFSYNIMIAAYAQNGLPHNARSLFDELPVKNEVSWTAMVSGYAQNGHVAEARSLFDNMPKKSLVPWNAMITAYAQSEQGTEAFKLFRAMDLEGVQADRITFISVIDACTSTGDLKMGLALHADVVPCRFLSDISVGTALVSMYGKCGRLEDAKCVFDEMPQKNVVSWTAMIAGYAQNGHLLEARNMFEQTSKIRNVVTWNVMLAAYAQNGHLHDARDIFNEMPVRNVVSWNSMMAAYGQFGNLQEANAMFVEMPVRNVVSWNAIVNANAQNGHGSEALQLFKKMDLEGMQANRATFLSVLEACSCVGDVALGKTVHSLIRDFEFRSHITVVTALVNMYAKCQGLEDAKMLFDSVEQQDVLLRNSMILAYAQTGHLLEARALFDEMPQKNLVSWNLILTAYVQNGYVEEAKKQFDQMTERDTVSWNNMMAGYAQLHCLEDARSMFDQMTERNVVSWNTIIVAYAQQGHCKEALQIFRVMDLEGVQANSFTFVSILEACSGLASLRESKLMHSIIAETGFDSDVAVATGIVNMYGKCGNLKDAKMVFDKIAQKNMVSWNSLMTAYAQNGQNMEALEHFHAMQLEGAPSDAITFITTISACSHAGLVENAREHFRSMKGDYGIEPNADHFACMIDLLGRAGRMRQAEELINSMPFEPDATTWTALLGACSMHGDVGMAGRVAERVLEMEDESAGPYVLLSNIYRSVGDLKEVARLRKLMEAKGLLQLLQQPV